jgi:hypothetical protein
MLHRGQRQRFKQYFFRLLSRGPGTTEAYLLFTLADAIFTGIVTGSELNIVVHPI